MKYIYFFGNNKAEGSAEDKNILGGKGANLAEMTKLGIPVPPGFTIGTGVCISYIKNGAYPDGIEEETQLALKKVEAVMGQEFGNQENPLLVSVRSGARRSMPGMMETVLNIGLTSETIPGLIKTHKMKDLYMMLIGVLLQCMQML